MATTGWRDPIVEVVPEEITPDLVLFPLAGAAELETVDAAIANWDLETAYAVLVYGLSFSDGQRIGRLILLGDRFAEAERDDRATLCYQQIYDTAVLSPMLNDPARADALLAAAKGWAALEQTTQALNAYDQVYVIAVGSPYLQMAHRRDLLTALEMAYRDMGDLARAEAYRAKIVELEELGGLQALAPTGEAPELPMGDEAISSPEVGALEEARREAAFALLQSLSRGGEPSANRVGNLAQALQAEDAAKMSLYQQELEAATQLSRRINIHWQVIRWLMIKVQVATAGFGFSVVPEWEAQLADIQSALSKAHEDLFFDYEDLVTALPEASLMGPGRYEVRRQVILAGRLGRYPNYPAQQMAEKLQDAVDSLIAAGSVDQLFADVAAEEEGLRFFLSPAQGYGLPAPPP
jgi:hypothetical protein